MGPDQPAEMSLHRSKETLDYEGFFISVRVNTPPLGAKGFARCGL